MVINGERYILYTWPLTKKKVYALYSCIDVLRKYSSFPAFQSHFMSYNFEHKSLVSDYITPVPC